MTSHYKRVWLMQYLRYTFTTGPLLVFAGLLNLAIILGGGFYFAQMQWASKCIATVYVCLLLLYMLVNLIRFINYKKFNR